MLNHINNILKNNLKILSKNKNLTLNDSFKQVGLDSINFIKLVVQIEIQFDIEFEPEDMNLDKFTNFQNLVSYIEMKINK